MEKSHAPFAQSDLDAYAARFNQAPFIRHFGFEISFPKERVVITLPEVRAEHRGGMGTDAINGGTLAAMFDYALGNTALLAPPLRLNATVQLSMSFERAVRGRSARCEARLDRAASKILFSSASIFDADGNVCARASAVVSMGPASTIEEWTTAVAKTHGDRT
jgi:acyl-coenzyme A thioesterase PaaI-like protein